MISYYEISPVEEICSECTGYGRRGTDWMCCERCDGIGRVFIAGGPSFGCKLQLSGRKRGEIVTLGNGDRGRVVSHSKRGRPSTRIALIDELFETESPAPTEYPSSTGVRSTLPALAQRDDEAGNARAKVDNMDPMQRNVAL